MNITPTSPAQIPEGDSLRRKGWIMVSISVICAILATFWFPIFRSIWPSFREMPQGSILFAAGLLLLLSPILFLSSGWTYLVKSLTQPRSVATPTTDRIIASSIPLFGAPIALFGAYQFWVGATTSIVHFKGGMAVPIQNHPFEYWLIMAFWGASTLGFAIVPSLSARKFLRQAKTFSNGQVVHIEQPHNQFSTHPKNPKNQL